MLLNKVLLKLDQEQYPFEVVHTEDGRQLFNINSDLHQALWWLNYSIIYENGIYFLTNSTDRTVVVHLKPETIPSKDGVFVELNLEMPEKYENE